MIRLELCKEIEKCVCGLYFIDVVYGALNRTTFSNVSTYERLELVFLTLKHYKAENVIPDLFHSNKYIFTSSLFAIAELEHASH